MRGPRRMAGDRPCAARRATAGQFGEEGSLCRHRRTTGEIVQRRHQAELGRCLAHLDRQCGLPRRWEHDLGRENLAYHIQPLPSFQTGVGQDDCIERPGRVQGAGEAGIDVAAQGQDDQVGSRGQQLRRAARAAGADLRTCRQAVQRMAGAADQDVGRVGASWDRADMQAIRRLCRQVLQTVDGRVDAAYMQRLLQLFCEQALAANCGQRAIELAVAARVPHLTNYHQPGPGCCQPIDHVLALPPRQGRSARPDDDLVFRHGSTCARRHGST